MSSLRNSIAMGLVCVFAAAGLSGCFSSHPRDIEAFSMPRDVIVTSDEYILEPPDEVEVHCTRVPEIHLQRQRIRPDGKVSFELLGDVQAAGKTPQELAAEIQQRIANLYTLVGDKPIEVRLIAYKSKVFYVLGQVYLPGPKLYTGRDSVLLAIAEARPNPMAWLNRIQVIRPSDRKDVKARIFEVNFDKMQAHGDTTKNVLLKEGDIVYVPPTVLAAIGMKIEEIIRPIARAFAGAYIVQSGGDRYVGGYGGGSSSYQR